MCILLTKITIFDYPVTLFEIGLFITFFLQFPMIDTNAISLNDTVKFFQHLAWTNKATSAAQKPSSNGVKQGENSRRQVSDDTTVSIFRRILILRDCS